MTLQDVADRAGVHRSTVALALRDHPRIPADTRELIRALAEKLGYRQNPLVAALMRSRRSGNAVKHGTLAFLTNYPTRDGWRPIHHNRPDFFPGAVARAKDFGYKLEHFWLGEPGMTPARLSAILRARYPRRDHRTVAAGAAHDGTGVGAFLVCRAGHDAAFAGAAPCD